MKKIIIFLLALSCFTACNYNDEVNTEAPPAVKPVPTAQETELAELDEVFITPSREEDNVDSIGVWKSPQGEVWTIITAKATDKLKVYNGATGEAILEVGQSGTAAGDLDRPNGIQVIDDLCIVVERNNKRVQLFSLPTFEHVGFIGGDVLIKPYGLSVYRDEADTYQLYVTDDYPATPEDA
jgi:3-phytase